MRTKQLAILMAVVAAVAVASYFVLRDRGKDAQSIRSLRSMAVLPFKTIGLRKMNSTSGLALRTPSRPS